LNVADSPDAFLAREESKPSSGLPGAKSSNDDRGLTQNDLGRAGKIARSLFKAQAFA